MGALYAVLGLAFGVAIAEAVHWRVGNAGGQFRSTASRGLRCSPTAQSRDSCYRFTAQDFYDR
jgi:hypothetical protein